MNSDRLPLLIVLLALLVMAVVTAAILLLREATQRDLERRIGAVATGVREVEEDAEVSLGSILGGLLRGLGDAVRRGTQSIPRTTSPNSRSSSSPAGSARNGCCRWCWAPR